MLDNIDSGSVVILIADKKGKNDDNASTGDHTDVRIGKKSLIQILTLMEQYAEQNTYKRTENRKYRNLNSGNDSEFRNGTNDKHFI